MDCLPPVVILGGSQFMGLTLLSKLENSRPVYVINRGFTYWDGLSKSYSGFNHIIADRDKNKKFTQKLKEIMEKHHQIEAIIDFSAYKLSDIQASVAAVQSNVKQYIYISSDSVYEVSNIQTKGNIKEEQAISISTLNDKERKKLKKVDSYGFKKLEVEQYLFQHLENVTSLRLADVIGPYDDSCRFWKYFIWSKIGSIDINDKDHVTQNLSFTFCEDVVDIILSQIKSPAKTYGIFNIACQESITLENFLNKFATTKYEHLAHAFYPSVECGFINIEKSKALNFKPTPLDVCLQKTLHFLTNVQKEQFVPEKVRVLKEMPKKLRKHIFENQKDFEDFIDFEHPKLKKLNLNEEYRSSSSSSSSSSSNSDSN